MSDLTNSQTAENILKNINQLPEQEKITLLQRLTFSVPLQLQGDKFTEIYKGRLIEVYWYEKQKSWVANYSLPDGEKVSEGFIYETAEECLKMTRAVITFEIERDEIVNSFNELIRQFKLKGYTEAGILNGLNYALEDTFSDSTWQKEIMDVLEKAIESARLPGRLLP